MKLLLVECNPFQPEHTPISLGYLASFAMSRGAETRLVNLGSQTRFSPGGFRRLLERFRPTYVGFSAYQRNIFLVEGLASLCKQILPGCKTLIGGPQATFLPTSALAELPAIDCVCRAEGEAAIAALLARWHEGADTTPIPGWSGRGADGAFWDGPSLEPAADLDDYPSPYLEGVLDIRHQEEAILLASRGCPYRCAFCYTPQAFGKKIRYHSLERVLEEIRWIHAQGVRRFWFADPSFTFHADRVHALLDALLRENLGVQMWMETRVDLVDRELLQQMKRAGAHTIAYGLESASPRVLRAIRKPIDLEQVQRAIRLSQEAGLDVELFSQYGLPHETLEDARSTLDFVIRNGVRIRGNTNAQQMQIYFGTEIEREGERFGIRPLDETRPAYLSVGSRYASDGMSAEEMDQVGRRWKAHSEDGGKHIVS